ncbi:hypothetical protein PAXRUDRAFT_19408 [Paxillus rubicundulus Ve08.2h10]|uniref:Uncharacterized protein n=1 Tax=Paxillus rubicundulus Ve08.2h10 TaxID=930991 RepID=A0A0D0BU74_9AGAM|nr:hypothetical protein PAXRUDRAFT_19408 [Paxillus rubicundulus Ve08.2h10]
MTTNSPLPSTSVGPSTSASTSPFVPSPTNDINIDAKNVLRVSHNSLLQARWNAGEAGVPIDEPLLSQLPDPPVINTGQEWISAYLSLTPGTRIQVVKALDAIKPSQALSNSSASTSKVIFTTDQEVKASSVLDSAYDLGIHSSIFDLANTSPLPSSPIEGLTLKKVKSSINGVTHHLLNLSQFESEDGMDSFTWQEAWLRYLVWLADTAQPVIHDCWKWHYTMLSKDEALRLSSMMNKTGNTGSTAWSVTLSKTSFTSSPLETSFTLPHPAMSRMMLLARMSSACEGQDPSFQDNTQSSDLCPKSNPLCLICQCTGHCFSDCKEETMAKGKQMFASTPEVILPVAPTAPPSASPSTSPIRGESARALMLLPSTSALSVASLLTASSRVFVSNSSCMDFYSIWYHELNILSSPLVPHVYYDNLSFPSSPFDHDEDFSRIVTPYSADAFDLFLRQSNLSHEFPELPFKLHHSFLLGKFKPLTHTYTPDNLPGDKIQ